ncbi:MAG: class I SAM-dependent methyltransferase [Lentisphaeria bacterium]|nr:class I SAM-dependent methyltransferase [Lentisphaeria bacterium]
MNRRSREYWDAIAVAYQRRTVISCADFHYGPLIPGDGELGLLPALKPGCRCLELGCGGAQNSICLASRGARCTAVDLSGGQLAAGRAAARRHGVSIAFVQGDLDRLPLSLEPRFDLVHSAYALPFVACPESCLAAMARLLRPGGVLLFSTAHPVAAGEWLEVEGEAGMFLVDYFAPPGDRRRKGTGEEVCRAVPVGVVFEWLVAAGLRVDRLLEPRALPVAGMTEAEIRRRVPYWSRDWLGAAEELSRVPAVAIFRASKPG